MASVLDREKSIFLEAAEIVARDERLAYLDQACGQDADLRAKVEALLAAHESPQPLLDATQDQRGSAPLGTQIGPYKLLQVIGEGGMGVVYMAEQTEPVARRVALKIIKPGMDTRQVIARFEAERQALAMMDHPNIAKVLDAGTVGEGVRGQETGDRGLRGADAENLSPVSCPLSPPAGRPYFVMELVKGVPITKYCDEHHLTLRQRLELFIPVCQAIQHAHQKGIIHRDIKPTNILVALYDGLPVPKVIDFGVAKATGPKLTEKTMFTQFGQLVGTLEYMSPEQAQFNQLDIDTRSDIYSLGVLLYELLTGTTPFDQARFRTLPFDETLRIIREEEPPKPSTRLSSTDTLSTIAANRGVEPAKLTRLIRGELDWIVMKALEKDRNRRYETASGLARDIERYLHDEPVQACTPSVSYRLSKFIRRNRRRLMTGALLGLALMLMAGTAAWLLRSATVRRQRSENELAAALTEAASLCNQGDWPKAIARVEQAERVLSDNVGAAKQEQLRVMRRDLEMVGHLEDLQLRISPFAEPTERLSNRDEATPEYAWIFQRYGIDVSNLDTETAAKQIRQSPIRAQLIGGLDDWISLARPDTPRSKHLRLVANLADANELCKRIRNAAEQGDRQTLLEIASQSEASALPLSTLLLLARALVPQAPDGPKGSTQVLRIAQRRFPGNFNVNVLLARRLATERPDQAAGFMRVAIANRPDNPVLWRFLGTLLHNAKHYDEAAAAIRQSISLDSTKYFSHTELGRALEGNGQWADAITAYTKALQLRESEASGWTPSLEPWHSGTLLRRAVCYGHLGMRQNAIADCSQSIDAYPHRSEAWFERSKCWVLLGDWQKAAQDAARAVELQPDDFNVRFVQAACLLMDCDLEGYRQTCAKALKRSLVAKDNNPPYMTARAYVLAPELMALPDELLSRVERIAGTPGSGGWLHIRAREHYRAGEFQAALARLDQAMKVDPAWDDRTCLNTLLYALVHRQLGHEAVGRKYLDRTKERLARGNRDNGGAGTFPVHIANWLSCQVLLCEVEGLLKETEKEESGVRSQESEKKDVRD